jgi:uncharacterized membrane protein (UPF0127 family)
MARPRPSHLLAFVAVAVMAVGLIVLASRRDHEPAPLPIGTGIAAALEDASPAGAGFPGLTETRLAVGARCLRLVVADELEERVDGLRGRERLGPYDGMLFVYEAPSTSSFTMSGVPVPLDIGFYGGRGRRVDREELEPCPQADASCPPYSSGSRYRFALETLRGELPSGALSACAA